MKVALVNVRYSPNLGDGLIAECLERGLARYLPGASFVSIDLAGRTEFSASAGSGRGKALALLAHLPKPLRQLAVSAILRSLISTRYRATWIAQLEGCTHTVLGGGQLLADADLNFPLKIGAVASLARAKHLPGAVFGVGVSPTWTHAGRSLFRKAMHDLAPSFVAVRDAGSAASWDRHFTGAALPAAQLCRDPGLLAAEIFPAPERPSRLRPLAGLGVIHPLTLNLHSPGENLPAPAALGLWKQMIAALLAQDMDVALFTNGPSDDEAFLDTILAALPEAGAQRVTRLPKPRRPRDLVTHIAGCDVIAAHRLHANIVAFACKVPHVGLGWDAKLPAFFESVGRGEFMSGEIQKTTPGTLSNLVVRALNTPIPEETHAQVMAETWAGIRACADALT